MIISKRAGKCPQAGQNKNQQTWLIIELLMFATKKLLSNKHDNKKRI